MESCCGRFLNLHKKIFISKIGMKYKILKLFALILLSYNGYSQNNYNKLPKTTSKCPFVIINETIISSESFVANNKDNVDNIWILKDKPTKVNHKFYNLSENGIVFFDVNKKVKTKTQAELNTFFALPKQNPIYINGYLIDNTDYAIATESIIKIELITPNTANKLKHKSINILICDEENNLNSLKK